MKIVITGVCGFVGSTIATQLLDSREGIEIIGLDNLSRPGSELNRPVLLKSGVKLHHLDIRSASDVAVIERADWVIDAAANPSVLAGVGGDMTSRQTVEHNLFGTVNLLEYCKRHQAGFVLLSTSRVYSVDSLCSIRLRTRGNRYEPVTQNVVGLTSAGVSELFSTEAPLSLYGATKRASEQLAIEYGNLFDFPVWVNRCGVLAGAGQFGKADQGIFSYWIHSYRLRRPLRYIGFGGKGHQVRDCLHPRDLVPVIMRQLKEARGPQLCNFSGGATNSMSLRELNDWCADRFGPHRIRSDDRPRPFDVPWLVLDSSLANSKWRWTPATSIATLLEEIAQHAETNPDWLKLTS